MPMCRAASTSGTVDMPTVSAPSVRSMRISAGVSNAGPSQAAYTPSPRSRPSLLCCCLRRRAQLRVVRVGHVGEAGPEALVVRADEGRLRLEVEMVGDEHQLARLEAVVDSADSVREDERADAEQAEHADAEDDLGGRDALVEVGAATHDGDRNAAEGAEDEPARVADGCRMRPAGDVLVRDLDHVLDCVREGAETAAEHDADRRRRLRPGTDRGDRSVELVLHGPTLHSFAVPWRWLVVAGLATLVVGGAASGAPQIKGPKVMAPAAIVIDASTGRVLWSKREHMRRPIASTTKIMTALVAMERPTAARHRRRAERSDEGAAVRGVPQHR